MTQHNLDTERLALANRLTALSEAFITEAGKWHHLNLSGELARNSTTLEQHARAALGSMPLDILDAYATAAETLLGRTTGARLLVQHIATGLER